MTLYRRAHGRTGTRVSHMLGIPMIVASLPLAPFRPRVAAGLFVAGWACQFAGHYVFEKNDPQFFGDRRNLVVGVAWTGLEWAHLVSRLFGGGRRRHRRRTE
jgi:uncharacterized membrane protein YGL010W